MNQQSSRDTLVIIRFSFRLRIVLATVKDLLPSRMAITTLWSCEGCADTDGRRYILTFHVSQWGMQRDTKTTGMIPAKWYDDKRLRPRQQPSMKLWLFACHGNRFILSADWQMTDLYQYLPQSCDKEKTHAGTSPSSSAKTSPCTAAVAVPLNDEQSFLFGGSMALWSSRDTSRSVATVSHNSESMQTVRSKPRHIHERHEAFYEHQTLEHTNLSQRFERFFSHLNWYVSWRSQFQLSSKVWELNQGCITVGPSNSASFNLAAKDQNRWFAGSALRTPPISTKASKKGWMQRFTANSVTR